MSFSDQLREFGEELDGLGVPSVMVFQAADAIDAQNELIEKLMDECEALEDDYAMLEEEFR